MLDKDTWGNKWIITLNHVVSSFLFFFFIGTGSDGGDGNGDD